MEIVALVQRLEWWRLVIAVSVGGVALYLYYSSQDTE